MESPSLEMLNTQVQFTIQFKWHSAIQSKAGLNIRGLFQSYSNQKNINNQGAKAVKRNFFSVLQIFIFKISGIKLEFLHSL